MFPDEDTGVSSLEKKERVNACHIGSPQRAKAQNERVLPWRNRRTLLPVVKEGRLFLTCFSCFDLAHCLVRFLG